MQSLGVYIPALYLEADADSSLSDFIAAYDEVHDELIAAIETIPTANQPRNAPLEFQDYIAAHYGNPFPFMTAERWQEGNRAENLVYIYSLRGTASGIKSVVQYLCGINITILQNFEYCWELECVSDVQRVPPTYERALGLQGARI